MPGARPVAAALALALLPALLAGCASSRPSPPCPGSWAEQPVEHTCLRATDPGTEVCNAYMDGAANQRVQCQAASTDGKVAVTYDLEGGGSARVRILDGAQAVAYDQTLQFSQSGTLRLTGASGTWTLDVDFQDTGGSARIVLYG